jgi:ADP-ribose pyrophosphatase
MKSWKRIEPTKVTKVGWRTITSKTFEQPDGNVAVFDLLHADGQEFAAVLALTPNNKVIIARQFRPGPEKIMDELPGGFVDKGETPEETATRELMEETGYKTGKIEFIGSFHKDPYMNSIWHGFIAYDCIKRTDNQVLEIEEHVEIDLISIETLIDNAMHDKMSDSGIVLRTYDKLRQIQKEES